MPVKSLGIHEESGAIVGNAKLEASGSVSLAYDFDHNSIIVREEPSFYTLSSTFAFFEAHLFAPALNEPIIVLI